ncbi:hypothetical protein L873DRAFT_680087 [Choiromyces venosus 120613-1]|uniref:Uncharacterized protein n=1 Tax=Choiromyces venosus 120613-1 TaxID=1336337 RepID=A0A3N4JX27_9PEZI|nr:hypothetical protein L873DRAFT_680087 [Choiromyces venosus 120613-1]
MKLIDLRREAGLSHVYNGIVHRALVSRGLHLYHEEFKPILGPEHKLNRLNYCCAKGTWHPAVEWADYMFTDEMSIEVGAVFGLSLVWREKGEKWHNDCIGTKKKNGTSVMCWGAIGWG